MKKNILSKIMAFVILVSITSIYSCGDIFDKDIKSAGGLRVVLQISGKDFLQQLSNQSDNLVLKKALKEADKKQDKDTKSYIAHFFQSFDSISKTVKDTVRLNDLDMFGSISDAISSKTTNAEIMAMINRQLQEITNETINIIKERVGTLEIRNYTVTPYNKPGQILIELPGFTDEKKLQNALNSYYRLAFWHTFSKDDLFVYLHKVNAYYKQDKSLSNDADSLNTSTGKSLFDYLTPQDYHGIGVVQLADKQRVEEMLNNPKLRKQLDFEQRYVKFLWGKPTRNNQVYLYAIKGNRRNEAPITNDVIEEALPAVSSFDIPSILIQMNKIGAKKWAEMTLQAFMNKTNIAIVINDVVLSAPGVSTGPISGGRSEITGNFTSEEAKEIARMIKTKKLPVKVAIVSSTLVEPIK